MFMFRPIVHIKVQMNPLLFLCNAAREVDQKSECDAAAATQHGITKKRKTPAQVKPAQAKQAKAKQTKQTQVQQTQAQQTKQTQAQQTQAQQTQVQTKQTKQAQAQTKQTKQTQVKPARKMPAPLSREEKQEILKAEAGKYLRNFLEKIGLSETDFANDGGKPNNEKILDSKYLCPCNTWVNTAKRGGHGEKTCPVFRDPYNGYPEKFSWAIIITNGKYDPVQHAYTHSIWGCLYLMNTDVARAVYDAFKPECC
jgi:hypothetical protein